MSYLWVKVRRLFINNRIFCFWVRWFESVILNNLLFFHFDDSMYHLNRNNVFSYTRAIFAISQKISTSSKLQRFLHSSSFLFFPLYCSQLFQPLQLPSSPSHSLSHHHQRTHLLPLFLFLFNLVAKSLRPDCDEIWEKSVRAPTKAGNLYNFHFMYVIFKIFSSYWRRYQFWVHFTCFIWKLSSELN